MIVLDSDHITNLMVQKIIYRQQAKAEGKKKTKIRCPPVHFFYEHYF